jgi:diguanylate cyclase (GGDEF)-like protein/PAS domain S-box-containing protein
MLLAMPSVRIMLKSLESILLVEDNSGDARLLREMFKEQSVHAKLTHVENLTAAETYLASNPVDLILLDLGLPDAQAQAAIRRARAAAPRVPLVVFTGRDDEALATQALQAGAQDYLIKGQIEPRALLRAMRYAVERKNMEEALFAEKERAQVTLNSIGDGVACTDIRGRISFLNQAAEKMTGWPYREAVGRPIGEVLRIVTATGREAIAHPTEPESPHDQSELLPPDCVLIRRDGLETPIESSVAPMHDREGLATGAVIAFHDVSAARAMAKAAQAMAEQMAHSAEHDFLTGLPNRMLFNDRVNQAITLAPRHLAKVAVLFLDLDGFKHINDSLGHAFGDKLLQSVAKRLVGCVRSADTVCRQGGDEFVVLLSEVEQSESAAITARRMLRAVGDMHSVDQHDLHVTASIGVSVYPDDGVDAETLIKNADTAMYQAKERGRPGYQFFKPAMNVRAVERQGIEESLRFAMERGEFSLHYQPRIDLKTEEIVGAEALLRWARPSRGQVAAQEFIQVAEDCGLIVPIGNWALREACQQARAWGEAGLAAGVISVNISAMEFRNEAFLDGVFAALRDADLDAKVLQLELTESTLMKHAQLTENILKILRGAGVQLAVDRFGTGNSSLKCLRKFPINALKIDRTLLRRIGAISDAASSTIAVIGMGRSLNLQVVAEGVETPEQLAFLRELRCDQAQGYYFSPPVPAEKFAELVRAGVRGIAVFGHQ